MVILQSHSLKFLQLLDLVIFYKYKSQLVANSLSNEINEVLQQSELAIYDSCTRNTLKKSFKMCSTYPFNPEFMMNKVPPLLIHYKKKKIQNNRKMHHKNKAFNEIKRIYSA